MDNLTPAFDDVLSLVPCAVFWKGIDGKFKGCNDAFLTFSGLHSKEQLIGKTDKELPWSNRWEAYHDDDQKVILTGKTVHRVEQVTTSVKEIFAHTTKLSWKINGDVAGVLGFIHDVTELVETEKAKEKIELDNQLKNDFIENMQHDFRTPLIGVCSGLASLIQQEADNDKKQQLALIYQSAKQLHHLCSDIISPDQVKHYETTIANTAFRLNELILNIIELNQTAAKQKGLLLNTHLAEEIPNILKSDPYRIKRILINLVANAIKFTETGTISIDIDCQTGQHNQARLEITVKDTGSGLSQDKVNFIHDQISKENLSSQTPAGLGLGLSLVKNFIADLDGQIEVTSTPNQGTCFSIALPVEIPESGVVLDNPDPLAEIDLALTGGDLKYDQIDAQAERLSNTPPLILLIEDDKLSSIAAKTALEKLGCKVLTASNIVSATELLDGQYFDMILSDLNLPDGSGLDIARYLKTTPHPINHKTPIFALTAHDKKQKLPEVIKAGFTDLLTKPLNLKKVLSILTQCPEPDSSDVLKTNRQAKVDNPQDILYLPELEPSEILELMQILYKELPVYIEQVKLAYEADNKEELGKILHKVIGGLACFKFDSLNKTTRQLAQALKTGTNLASLESLIEIFYAEANEVMRSYEIMRDK